MRHLLSLRPATPWVSLVSLGFQAGLSDSTPHHKEVGVSSCESRSISQREKRTREKDSSPFQEDSKEDSRGFKRGFTPESFFGVLLGVSLEDSEDSFPKWYISTFFQDFNYSFSIYWALSRNFTSVSRERRYESTRCRDCAPHKVHTFHALRCNAVALCTFCNCTLTSVLDVLIPFQCYPLIHSIGFLHAFLSCLLWLSVCFVRASV